MGRGRRILLGLWVVANAALLAFLVVNPKITRSLCDGHWVDSPAAWIKTVTSDEELGQDACAVQTNPVAERGEVVVGAVVGNGVLLAASHLSRRSGR